MCQGKVKCQYCGNMLLSITTLTKHQSTNKACLAKQKKLSEPRADKIREDNTPQSDSNLLRLRFPKLFACLHPTKNVGIDLDTITCGSSKKLWWRCPHVGCILVYGGHTQRMFVDLGWILQDMDVHFVRGTELAHVILLS